MVIVKAEIQERKIADNIVWLYFQTKEPFCKSTDHFHKDLFFHTKKHLDHFANLIGQEAMNLVEKIMRMKNVISITIFSCDERASNYNNQRLVVGIDTTNTKERSIPGIKSYIKRLLIAVPVEKKVVKIPF